MNDPEHVTLREIAERTGADKLKHKYESHYETHLGPWRESRIRLLEIGVKRGASLAMWEQYFPLADIFGLDIEPACRRYETDRSKIFVGDQEDPACLRTVMAQIGQPLDVVIDDGGHTMKQQRTSFETLFEYVRPGGLYIVEDTHTSYRDTHGGGAPGTADTFIMLLKGLLDDLHFRVLRKQGYADRFPVSAVHAYPKICFIVKGDHLVATDVNAQMASR